MTPARRDFVDRTIRKKRLFLALAMAGVAIALLLALFYGYQRWQDPTYPLGARSVIVLLILLNARQNLRQYRCAGALGELTNR